MSTFVFVLLSGMVGTYRKKRASGAFFFIFAFSHHGSDGLGIWVLPALHPLVVNFHYPDLPSTQRNYLDAHLLSKKSLNKFVLKAAIK